MTRASRICRICDRPGLPDHPVQEYEYPQYCRGIDADCISIGYKIQLDRADEYELKLDSLRENLERQVELQRARAEKAEWERDEARAYRDGILAILNSACLSNGIEPLCICCDHQQDAIDALDKRIS